MRKFLAKFWQIKFNNIQKKVIIQHGQVRFIQKHKLGLTFEKINQYNLPYWDERRKKHDYLKRYRKSTGQISASIHVKIISINIRRKIPGHPWKHGGITVSGPYGVTLLIPLTRRLRRAVVHGVSVRLVVAKWGGREEGRHGNLGLAEANYYIGMDKHPGSTGIAQGTGFSILW